MMQIEQLLAETIAIATEAGRILSSGFGSVMSVHDKDGVHNLVTEYDLRVEAFLLEQLNKLVPGASFLGEEGGMREGISEFKWVVDPLDGTVNFAHGIPIFCVSIGAVINNELALGVIHQPLLDETFSALSGGGAFLNGEKIRVSQTATVGESILATGFPYDVEENPSNCLEQFQSVIGKGLPVRRLGSAAIDLAYSAAGRFDGFCEVRLQPWDIAAGAVILKEAGGSITHYGGRPFQLGADSVVATNGKIHEEMLVILGTAQTDAQ